MTQPSPALPALPFLLEIGSEEIPARFIPGSLADLRTALLSALAEAHLEARGFQVLATPRRLAVLIESLDAKQPDRDLEIKGPPVSAAFDGAGKPTPAALGFARKAGVDLADCRRGSDARGEFLLARKQEPGLPAEQVLAQMLPGIILGLPFRKVMRWGDHDLEYPRPLQWIVALLGERIVELQVDYLSSGRTSRGHRTLAGDRPVEISRPQLYLQELADAGVIVDPQQRQRLIEDGFARELAVFSGRAELVQDQDLLQEIVFLCEHPTPFLGIYDEDFFALPPEVIATALKSHQRYFTIRDRDSRRLLPRFAAVRDGGGHHLANVVAGNERVLRARLADALFYWKFDQQKSPDQRVAMLEAVTWLESFGSVGDKSRRLVALASWLWTEGLGLGPEVPATLARAAAICKSDLVSEMIKDGKEFTKLEGLIGARYAEMAGEDPQVCRAVERHHAPRTSAGELPGDPLSSCLSLADRLDTVAGCWLAGFVPTGAKDPYALRRHVLAVVRILLEHGWRLDLMAGFGRALDLLADFAPERSRADALAKIADFARTRLEGHLTEARACPAEVVRAVLAVRWRDPVDALAWIGALTEYRDKDDFQQMATGFKRCRNILKGDTLAASDLDRCLERWLQGGGGSRGEDFGLLAEPQERTLRELVAGRAAEVASAEAEGRYSDVFAIFSGFGPAIDAFFTEVRVNVQETEMREARLAFLREIHGIFARYGDFTEMYSTEN